MENRKPFKTFDEQIDILKGRGLHIADADRDNAKRLLMCEGYYAVVNGYKDIFIDEVATRAAGDDRYRDGTTFDNLSLMFSFDRILRRLTLATLISAETTIRTAVVYSFCDKHRAPDAYLNAACYCGRNNYHHPACYDENLTKMLGILRDAHGNAWDQDCIAHYLDNHGHVPLWVLVNTLTFGNVSHFYSLQQRSAMNETCRIISEGQRLPRIRPNRLRTATATLVDFRNICAHDDRLYCARTGRRHDRKFSDMLLALEVVTGDEDMARYIYDVSAAVALFDALPNVREGVIDRMGVSLEDGIVVPNGGWRRDHTRLVTAMREGHDASGGFRG